MRPGFGNKLNRAGSVKDNQGLHRFCEDSIFCFIQQPFVPFILLLPCDIEFFAGLLPKMGQRAAYLLVTALSIAFLATITFASSNMLWLGTIMTSTAMGIPMILVYSAVPAGSVLMILYLAWDCYITLRSHEEKEDARC